MKKSAGLLVIIYLFLSLSCSRTSVENKDKSGERLFSWGSVVATLNCPALHEASGLAASRQNPGYLWSHNDSGDKARLFLIDTLGNCRAQVTLQGVTNRDWEDIAIGPGPETDVVYLYVADIGDNLAVFPVKYIYRIKEPKLPIGVSPIDTTLTEIDTIAFELPDGVKDAETLLCEPTTGDLYVFSKREKNITMYRLKFPQNDRTKTQAEKIQRLPYTQLTAGDISPNGEEVILKNYQEIYYWRKESPQQTLEDLLKKPAIKLPYKQEPQGESVTFSLSGSGYYTLSEEVKDQDQHVVFYKRIKQ